MKITFLGTSSGKTSLDRYHSSIYFSVNNYNLLVDAGDGISRALLKNRIDFTSIDGIIFTHLHPDHYSGFASLIVQMKIVQRVKPLEIFVQEDLKAIINDFLIRSYLIAERMPFKIIFKGFKDDKRIKIADDFHFIAKRNSHLDDLKKYLPDYPTITLYSASILFEWNNKKIVYTSDIGTEEDFLLFNNSRPDILICEATHLPIEIILKLLDTSYSRTIYFTHYTDESKQQVSEILAKASQSSQKTLILAEDNLSFEL